MRINLVRPHQVADDRIRHDLFDRQFAGCDLRTRYALEAAVPTDLIHGNLL
jgi:hypothetical protein